MSPDAAIGYVVAAVSGAVSAYVAVRVSMTEMKTQITAMATGIAKLEARDDKHADGMGEVREDVVDHEARIKSLEEWRAEVRVWFGTGGKR